MSRFASNYELGRPTRRCHVTGRELRVGDAYVAALLDQDASAKPLRLDFSLEAWNAEPKPIDHDRLIGSWRTHVHAAGEKPKPILDDETMLELFEATGDDEKRAGLRLVLALMLIRKRILAHEGNRGTSMLVRHRGTPREQANMIEVKDPGLDESTIGEVIMEIEGLASGGDAPAENAAGQSGNSSDAQA
jgi:hypothetical protein